MSLLLELEPWSYSQVVHFTALTPTAKCPTYGSEGAAGLDMYADEKCTIFSQEHHLVAVNIAIMLPKGFMAQVLPRSGLALKHGITVLNSPGLIDEDYRGPISALLYNTSLYHFEVNPGDRIAQLVISKYERVLMQKVAYLDETTRGAGGFGSTGVR